MQNPQPSTPGSNNGMPSWLSPDGSADSPTLSDPAASRGRHAAPEKPAADDVVHSNVDGNDASIMADTAVFDRVDTEAESSEPATFGTFQAPAEPDYAARVEDDADNADYADDDVEGYDAETQADGGWAAEEAASASWDARRDAGVDSETDAGVGRHHQPGGYDLTPPPALDQNNLVNTVKQAPRGGWRKALYTMSGGAINVGDSKADREYDELVERIRQPLRGDYRIAVMSLKGGVGKTTTTVALGGVFASVRHDRVIAIDANPDLGTLAQRVAAPGPATIRDLLAAKDVSRYAQVREYTTQASSRLEVIGSERDPAVSEAFSEHDYRHAIDILQHHYNVILTDCGTGLMHSAMSGVLELANSLVLVTSPALDGAQSASATLDWLNLHGYEQLAANAVVVVSAAHPGNATIDMEQLLAHFRSRTRAVQVIPFDRHLSEGATVDLELIGKDTKRAYMELAAIVAEDFDAWHRHAS